jgi:hypothetical protein
LSDVIHLALDRGESAVVTTNINVAVTRSRGGLARINLDSTGSRRDLPWNESNIGEILLGVIEVRQDIDDSKRYIANIKVAITENRCDFPHVHCNLYGRKAIGGLK